MLDHHATFQRVVKHCNRQVAEKTSLSGRYLGHSAALSGQPAGGVLSVALFCDLAFKVRLLARGISSRGVSFGQLLDRVRLRRVPPMSLEVS
jgi:hypothetical protein